MCPPGTGLKDDGSCSAIDFTNGQYCFYADFRSSKVNCALAGAGYVYDPTAKAMTNCPSMCAACRLTDTGDVVCTATLPSIDKSGISTLSHNNIITRPGSVGKVADVGYYCPMGCRSCYGNGSCTQCMDGFYTGYSLDGTNVYCADKKDGCSAYDRSTGFCYLDPDLAGPISVSVSASEGQYFDGVSIKKCPQDCASCAWNQAIKNVTCIRCRVGFAPAKTADGKAMMCKACAVGCRECNGEKAEECFILELNKCYAPSLSKIVTCDRNCLWAADAAGTCGKCKEPYILAPDKKSCIQSSKGGCAAEANGQCTKCLFKYWKNGATCSMCGTIGSTDCDICTTDKICTRCKPSNPIATVINGQCTPCPINCLTCSAANKCTTCLPGYFPAADGSCQACGPACSSCISTTTCGTCLSKVGTKNVLKSASGQCVICDEGCTKCTAEGSTAKCTECSEGFYLSTTGTCLRCGTNCAKCTSAKCTTCVANGFPRLDGITCKVPSNCRPSTGLNLVTGKCEDLGIPYCTSGTIGSGNKTTCLSTADGYYWDGTKMGICPDRCQICRYDVTKKYLSCLSYDKYIGAISAWYAVPNAAGTSDLVGNCPRGCGQCRIDGNTCANCLVTYREFFSITSGGLICKPSSEDCPYPSDAGMCFTEERVLLFTIKSAFTLFAHTILFLGFIISLF
jgi:hypothetical protein